MPPAVMGKDIPLSGIYDPSHKRYGEAGEFRAARRRRTRTLQEVVETALGIEGLKRQWGVHAAGVIMSSEPLHRRHPDHAPPAGRPGHHPVRLPELRGLGLIKMDFLGLRNLTILDDALDNMKMQPGRSTSTSTP